MENYDQVRQKNISRSRPRERLSEQTFKNLENSSNNCVMKFPQTKTFLHNKRSTKGMKNRPT